MKSDIKFKCPFCETGKLETALDSLEGEVHRKDVVKACEKLINEYKNYSD